MPHFKVEIYKWELLLPLSLQIYLCDMYESSEMWDLGMQFLTDSIFEYVPESLNPMCFSGDLTYC